MAAAEERHRPQVLGEFAAQGLDVAGADAPETEEHHAAAALAQAGAEGIAAHVAVPRRGASDLEHVARLPDRLELELAAADGGRERIGPDRHPGAGLARHRALRGGDADQHAFVASREAVQKFVDGAGHDG